MIHVIKVTLDDDELDHDPFNYIVGPVSDQFIQPDSSTGLSMSQTIVLIDTQKVTIEVTAADKKLAPTTVQDIRFAIDNSTVASVSQDPSNPQKATVIAGLPGTAVLTITGDSDPGDGFKAFSRTIPLVVNPGEAVTFGITIDTPEDQ